MSHMCEGVHLIREVSECQGIHCLKQRKLSGCAYLLSKLGSCVFETHSSHFKVQELSNKFVDIETLSKLDELLHTCKIWQIYTVNAHNPYDI